MAELKTTMDILKILKKNNCRECGEKTCLAFAAAVHQGRRQLNQCPYINDDILALHEGHKGKRPAIEASLETEMEHLKAKIADTDLSARAGIVGGVFHNGRLTIKIFGKDFHIYPDVRMVSDIHINPWMAIPLLNYILICRGKMVSGDWAPFRELAGGREMAGLFTQRCELPLKNIADKYTDLFEDLIRIFNGLEARAQFDADIALILHPFPKLPMLFCYWKPEEDIQSDLKLFFDKSAAENLGIESIYGLGTGLARMFEKFAARHGFSDH